MLDPSFQGDGGRGRRGRPSGNGGGPSTSGGRAPAGGQKDKPTKPKAGSRFQPVEEEGDDETVE